MRCGTRCSRPERGGSAPTSAARGTRRAREPSSGERGRTRRSGSAAARSACRRCGSRLSTRPSARTRSCGRCGRRTRTRSRRSTSTGSCEGAALHGRRRAWQPGAGGLRLCARGRGRNRARGARRGDRGGDEQRRRVSGARRGPPQGRRAPGGRARGRLRLGARRPPDARRVEDQEGHAAPALAGGPRARVRDQEGALHGRPPGAQRARRPARERGAGRSRRLTVRAFSVDERRARLAQRHFLAPGSAAGAPVELAEGLGGMHATDPSTVFLAAQARLPDSANEQLERALYQARSMVRMIGMLRTLFVPPLELAAVVRAACTETILVSQRRRYAKLVEEGGIAADGEAWLEAAGDATLRALEARGEAYASELSKDVPQLREKLRYGEGKTWAGSVGMTSWVLFLLAAEGRIVRCRPRGAWTSSQWSWTHAASWLPSPLARLEQDAARAELASRWLAAYGPASVADLKWWSGWTLKQTREA